MFANVPSRIVLSDARGAPPDLGRRSDWHIASATIAYGGVAPTVIRLPKTEAVLAGKPLRLETFEQAGVIARGEVKPISDVRGSANYRLQLVEKHPSQVLVRHLRRCHATISARGPRSSGSDSGFGC